MTREKADAWCEKGILIVVTAAVAYGPLATGAVRTPDFLVVQALTAAALLLWLPRFWLTSGYRLLWPPICWVVISFLGYAVVRYQQADLEYVARRELVHVATYTILFLVILNNLCRQESTQIVSWVLIFLAMAISLYAIFQFATGSNRVWHLLRPTNYLGRGSGTYINPNHLAGFLGMVLPLGLAFVLIGRVSHATRVFLAYASSAVLAGIGVTLSRGGWLACAGSLLLFFALLIRKRQFRIPALILLLVLVVGVSVFYRKSQDPQHRIQNVLADGSRDDSHMRYWLWGSALEMWRDHPWVGVGPGHFDYRFPQYRPLFVQSRPGYAHNDYLNCLADWGLVGAFLVASAWFLLFAGVFKTWKYVRREENALGTSRSNRAAFVIGATTGLVAILIHSLFDFNMYIPANAIVAVALTALLSSQLRFASERYWVRPGSVLRTVASIAGIAAIGWLSWQGWLKAHENRWITRARRESSPENRLAALKKAAAVEPANFEVTYAIGESLRRLSWLGNTGFDKQATDAIEWFGRGTRLNPYDAYNYLGTGMCLDWLGRHTEAAPYYQKALNLDPNNYYLQAHQGWHFVQIEDYKKAKYWFERSYSTKPWDNPIALNYLPIVERKLKEASPGNR